MKTFITLLCAGLLVTLLTAMDCAGGTHQCSPPEGTVLGEALYCKDGARGICDEGGHQGDTVFRPDPCPDGTQCVMSNDKAMCEPFSDASTSDSTTSDASLDAPSDTTPPDVVPDVVPDATDQ